MLGTNRVKLLAPTGCNGSWGHATDEVFGFTLYDTNDTPSFTLNEIRAFLTSPTGVETVEVVHDGLAFVTPWDGATSAYNDVTGECTMDRGTTASGTTIRFRVEAEDGDTNVSYMSWVVGIGDAPGHASVAVGALVRSHDGRIWRVRDVTGTDGSKRYKCECCDRTVAGHSYFTDNDIATVGPRDRLSSSIMVSE